MTNQELQTFLNIIDNRIKKYIKENKLLKEYPAIVTSTSQVGINEKCKVKLVGYQRDDDTEFTFVNKSHEILRKGNYVYVKTFGTDLNTGVISQKR